VIRIEDPLRRERDSLITHFMFTLRKYSHRKDAPSHTELVIPCQQLVKKLLALVV